MDKEIKNDGKFKKGNKQGRKYSSTYQPSEQAKSEGQINLSKERNILYALRTGSTDRDLLNKYLNCIDQQLQNGDTREAGKLFSLIKENEPQEIKNSGSIEIQKVFVTKEEIENANKHIDDIINNN